MKAMERRMKKLEDRGQKLVRAEGDYWPPEIRGQMIDLGALMRAIDGKSRHHLIALLPPKIERAQMNNLSRRLDKLVQQSMKKEPRLIWADNPEELEQLELEPQDIVIHWQWQAD